MPLIIDGGRVPPRWATKKPTESLLTRALDDEMPGSIGIAFINNMPDSALEDTELQFFDLLDSASDGVPIHVKLYSLPGVGREARGQQHLSSFYFGIEDLWNRRFDGVIMTGTEPHQTNLRNEPYWPALAKVLDWAEHNTASTVLSCLAAHAGVLHSDGIERHPLPDKRFGVFHFKKMNEHPMAVRKFEHVRFPHSRWNEVQADALTSCGYVVLTGSSEAGVDSFVKLKKKSLFLHFQGHPEYGCQTLLKEYRRDIRRFMKGERKTYPSLPHDYFNPAAEKLLAEFQRTVMSDAKEEMMAYFPEAAITDSLQNTWHLFARSVYRNWLQYLALRKAEVSTFPTIAAAYQQRERKRSVAR